MKIQNISFTALHIPFRFSFNHASSRRKETGSFLITLRCQSGIVTYGEGMPRDYVSGETLKSCEDFFNCHLLDIKKINSLTDIKNFIKKNKKLIEKNPAIWCGIELALLDGLAQEQHKTMEALLGLPELEGKFVYSAILGLGSLSKTFLKVFIFFNNRFKDFKIKINGDFKKEKIIFRLLHFLGIDNSRIRLDANNFWKNQDYKKVIQYLHNLKKKVYAIEEPLSEPCDYEGMRKIIKATQIPIVLDESFRKLDDIKKIQNDPQNWIVNVRISHSGGLIQSLEIVEELKKKKIRFIVGTHVGETSLLTRAGLTLANAYKDDVLFQEGAISTHLLQYDPFYPNIKIKKRGEIDISSFLFEKQKNKSVSCYNSHYGFGLLFKNHKSKK